MGLFTQEIRIGIKNKENVIEKVALPKITKANINLYVEPGSYALVNGMKLKGQPEPHKLSLANFGNKKTIINAFLYQDKSIESISVDFFAGQHMVNLSSLKGVKATFSIVGNAMIEVDDYKTLAKYYDKTLSKEDLKNDIVNNYRSHLSNEIGGYADKHITPETTEIELRGALDSIVNDVMTNSRKTTSMLSNMGLMISMNGITLHLNAIDETDEVIEQINTALREKALGDLNNDNLEREHRYEIDRIKAERTNRTETETTVINNGQSPVTVNTGSSSHTVYCEQCGAEITSETTKFCPKCGAKINR